MKLISISLICFLLSLTTMAAEATNKVAQDNSGINKRDDSVVEMTAEDQSNNPADQKLPEA